MRGMYGYAGGARDRRSIADVIEHVAFEFDHEISQILSSSRKRRLTWARYAVAWLARRHTRKTLEQIGRAMGDRHHSTISHEIKRAEELRESDGYFRHLVDHLDGMLGAAA